MNYRIAQDTGQVEFDSSFEGAVVEPVVLTREEFNANEEVYNFFEGNYNIYLSEQY